MTAFVRERPLAPAAHLDRAARFVLDYGPAAFILTLPLEFTSVYLRQQLSRFVLVVVALAFIYAVIARLRVVAIPRTLSVALLAIYVFVSLASWTLTRAPGSTSALIDVVLYPILALLLTNLVATEHEHRRAWNAFVISALAVSVLGAFLFLSHLSVWTPNPLVAQRLNITFGDPNITARFLTLGACAAILVYAARMGSAWLCFAAAVACGAVLPLTLSRSGLGLFPVTAVLAVIVSFDRRRALTIALAAVITFVVVTGANPDTRQRAQEAYATVASAVTGKSIAVGPSSTQPVHNANVADDNRVYLIHAGLAMFSRHPIAGVGFGGYQHALLTTYKGYLPPNRTGANLDTLSHAALVTIMAEQGVVGTVLFLAFLLALAVESWRGRRRAGPWAVWVTIPATLIVPVFIYSQIEGRLITEPYFWLSVGLLYSALMRQRAVPAETNQPVRLRRVA